VIDALAEPFFRRALLAALLASVACGVLGTFVVAKRITSLAGGLAHAAFGGVGLGYWLGFSPMLGAAGFGVLGGVLVGVAQRRLRSGLDTLVSTLWAAGMALGIVFVALAPGYAPDLLSYLFGSLLLVSWHYLWIAAGLDLLVLVVVFLLFARLQAVCFDEEFAEVVGLPVERLFVALLALTALAVVTLIRVVGVILVIALLAIPAATARHWTHTLPRMMVLACAVAAACTCGGLFASWTLSQGAGAAVPPGPLIVLLATGLFCASAGARRWSRSRQPAGTL
jgi:zinc transport system permease protein